MKVLLVYESFNGHSNVARIVKLTEHCLSAKEDPWRIHDNEFPMVMLIFEVGKWQEETYALSLSNTKRQKRLTGRGYAVDLPVLWQVDTQEPPLKHSGRECRS